MNLLEFHAGLQRPTKWQECRGERQCWCRRLFETADQRKKVNSGKPDSDGLTSVTNVVAAMDPTVVGLARDRGKALTISCMRVAQNITDTTHSEYIKSACKLQPKFVTQEDLGVAKKHNANPLFAFVDNSVPGTINAAHQSPSSRKST